MRFHKSLCSLAATFALLGPAAAQTVAPTAGSTAGGSFADNPIVYFVVTDRFVNGNTANDNSHGSPPTTWPRSTAATWRA